MTPRDQEFFAEKGWGLPKRCKPCQKAKRKAFDQAAYEREQRAQDKRDEEARRAASPFMPILERMRGELSS